MRRIFIILGLLTCLSVPQQKAEGAARQDTSGVLIPIYLQYWHDLITKEQEKALQMAAPEENSDANSSPDPVSLQTKSAVTGRVNAMRSEVESSDMDRRHKILYLSAIYNMLRRLNLERRYGRINAALTPKVISSFEEMMKADRAAGSIVPVIEKQPYAVGAINLPIFQQNFGFQEARALLLRKYAEEHPENFLNILNTGFRDLAAEPFVDTILGKIAHRYPEQVYDYATSFTLVGNAVRKSKDPLVRAIVQIGKSPSATRLLPFVDYVVDSTYTIAQLEKIAADDDAFYKLSVKTMMDMNRKGLSGEPPIGVKAMERNVKRRALKYIREVNDLHESPDAVRFACTNKFSSQEIYYLLINGQEEIYTSSFVGLYKRMMQRLDPPRGDQFLMSLIFDRFRKFITLAAAYNTLDGFLASMSQQNASLLMKKFVGGLENSDGLEDAVDVADAFASIKDSVLLRNLQGETNRNYQTMVSQGNARGKVIYGLLTSLFNTRESSNNDSVWSKGMSRKLNLPPIDYIPFKSLVNDSSGIVYQVVFFYGDKDGFDSYNSFMSSFRGSGWRVSQQKYWTTIGTTKGHPITIFAKRPQADPDEDQKGMDELQKYLEAKEIRPTVYIHRGHSYHVNSTIAELQSSARLVMLGSCGGYNSLAGVLNVAPDAQIISSKQTGSMYVNEPIIRTIEETIRSGKDLDWIKMWGHLNNQFKGDKAHYDMFEDYIPPHKNLGAIFIKAYKKLMNENAPVDTTT